MKITHPVKLYSNFTALLKNLKYKSLTLTQIEILIELLELEMDHHHITNFLKIDITDENFIRVNLHRFQIMFKNLLKETSFRDALLVTLRLKLNQLQRTQDILKILAYPLFLFLSSLLMMIFVSSILLPSIYTRIAHMTQQTSPIMVHVMQFYSGLSLTLICIIIIFMKTRFKHVDTKYYLTLNEHSSQNLWTLYISYLINEVFIELSKLNLNLNLILHMLSLSSHPIIKYIAHNSVLNLKQGRGIQSIFPTVDLGLISLFTIEDEESKLILRLIKYQNYLKLKLYHQFKYFKLLLLTLAYFQLGFIVLATYQALYYPLNYLEKLT